MNIILFKYNKLFMILIKIVQKKKVLSLVLKTDFNLQLLISYGSLFQQQGAY